MPFFIPIVIGAAVAGAAAAGAVGAAVKKRRDKKKRSAKTLMPKRQCENAATESNRPPGVLRPRRQQPQTTERESRQRQDEYQ